MRIRSLEIAGFKSFGQRATLVFNAGISAIVGPNGCGKSNVVDAIRWVMGEQNPRHLRGRRMEDIIFGGTQTAQPSGMAEVVMALDNSDGSGPGIFKDFREIEVARRLYRTGESEYLINKVPVRLRDVLDFFMDTGIGTRGYTIVEQGSIAGIVSSRPEDRRAIFEEAAGIGKYRQRRAETLSKLKSTEQNLTRVNDVLGELSRQIGSLERQAKRARRHKELSARLRDVELVVTRDAHVAGRARERELEHTLATQRDALVGIEARLARSDADLETERHQHVERERALAESSERLFAVRGEIQALEGRIEFERREGASLERLIEQREEEIAGLAARLERDRAERAALEHSSAGSERGLEESRAEVSARELELREGRAALSSLQSSRDSARTLAGARGREAAGLASRRDSLAERAIQEERRLVENDTELERAQAEAETLGTEVERLQHEVSARSDEHKLAGQWVQSSQAQQAQARAEVAGLQEQLGERRSVLAEIGARLTALEEQERQAGARVEEVVARLPDAARAQMQGPLWRQLEVEEGLEGALEAVLAGHPDALLFATADAALAYLAELRGSDVGRASAVVTQPAGVPGSSGFVPLGRPLAARVRAPQPLQLLVERLLRDVYVVDDLAEVVERYGASTPPALFVTAAGDLLDSAGVMTGGRGSADGAIRRGAQLRRLRTQHGSEQELVRASEQALAAAGERAGACEVQLDHARKRMHELEIAAVDLGKDLQRARERAEDRRRQLERQRTDRASRAALLERIGADRESAAESFEVADRERLQLEADAAELAAQVDARGAQTAELERALGEARVLFAEQRARRDEQRAALERLAAELVQHERWIAQRREEVESARGRAADLRAASEAAEQEIAGRIEAEAQARAQQEQQREQFEEGSARIEGLDQQARALARERGERQQALTTAELQLQELRLRQDQQRERILERYGIDIESWVPVETQEQGDAAERESELKKLRESLESLGSVHLGAIEEYEEVAERHRYLSEQKADLELSIERLQNAIQRINRTSRARFRETFDAVNACFQELFPRMFRGGRAELTLTESEDVLEAGIEIHAQPPGKRLQTVNLLSGGEKSLTALSLLMAVFRVKPSPFFLLDEVDAALDDANVGRFDALLREMAGEAQFLVITHNKSSIEGADTLFGVTMEEPGQSRLVSVDVVQTQSAVGAQAAAG